MLQTHLKTAWRHIRRNKVFSFINVVGLALGLTSLLLIALYVFDELTFDRFHKNTADIYRLVEHRVTPEGKETNIGGAGYQISERAKVEFPEIKNAVRLVALSRTNVSTPENTNVFYEDFWISNSGFLQTFDFEMLYGNRQTALTAPHSVVVTEETARKLFNTTDVLGRRIKAELDSVPFQITGVLKNFPANSQFSFNLLFSETTFPPTAFTDDWDSHNFFTYFLLDSRASVPAVAAKINRLAASHRSADNKDRINFTLQPLKEVHFNSEGIENTLGRTGSITYIYVFSLVAVFILLLACINYMNLTTALFTKRAKEVGVRKMIGASRKNLVNQFLSEAFLTTLLALGFALLLVKLLLPAFNTFTEKQLTLNSATDYRIWLGLGIIMLLVGLLAGIYPALFQSRLKPLELFKNKMPVGNDSISLRRFLVVLQFSVSITMMVATLVVYQQMLYVQTKDMGFTKSQLVVIDINSGQVRRGAGTIKNELAKLPRVKAVTVSSRVPGEWKNLPKVSVKNSNTTGEMREMYFLGVDEQFLATYQINLLKGRNFRTGSLADSTAVLLNETAARQLGIQEPAEQIVQIPATNFGGNSEPLKQPYRVRVVGIVKDFNFQTLREPLAPMVIAFQKNPIHSIDYFTVRMGPANASETIKQMEAVLHGVDQDHLFEYHFLDDQWSLFYRDDKIRQTIFLAGAVLAILIGCLGLFGLATFAAEQRTKEIGIRKVLGASVQSIVFMLSKDFLKLVLLAAIIAFPVAGYAMHQWLQDFAFRIHLGWWIFALAGGMALLIALFTISFQAIKAAVANPVKALRSE
ncbi:ABC transporter permease [Adhaeribacter radiodurans]|uniref:ABC transporter permease n=1 Tax=Adhaeribacter radiodurans TaxID=2745197 RepID=A0A7L7L1R5_9BACT|nr:ABC transporter permease [Adhaeribacter radiodurans]QMU26731.1 ABC transporter permease [Adhaeribacter radiodurans]